MKPDREVEPGRSPDHDHGDEERGGQEAGDGDRVGRRGQRGRPERRLAPGVRLAHRFGSHGVEIGTHGGGHQRRRAARPATVSSGRCTMPSISGASWTVRPRPGASTSTCRRSPTSRSRRAAVIPSCSSAHSRKPLQGQRGRDLIGKSRRRASRLRWRRGRTRPSPAGPRPGTPGAGRGRARSPRDSPG